MTQRSLSITKFNYIGIQTEFEGLYQQVRPSLNNDERIEFKSKLMTLYHKYKSSFYYERKRNEVGLTQDENETLEKLSKDKSIIICKADKGNSVAVLDRNDYTRKMNNILLDKSKFKKVSKDSNLDDLVKFQRFLYNLKRKKEP